MAGGRFPTAMEVVGHEVEEIDGRFHSSQIHIGNLVGTSRRCDRNLVLTASGSLKSVQTLADCLEQ